MGQYDQYRKQGQERPWKVHPIWRGIGCLLIIVTPIMAYAAAAILVDANKDALWVPVPWDLMGPTTIPVIELTVDNLFANLALAAVLTIAAFGFVMIIYTIIYTLMGPSRYGPVDSPPVRRKPGKRSSLKR